MTNMSYCRFQNTLGDLKDCLYAVEDAMDTGQDLKEFTSKLGEDELYSYRRMYEVCKLFIEAYEQLEEYDAQ